MMIDSIKYTIEQCKSPYRQYWIIKDEAGHTVWIEYTKDECERVIKDGTLQRAIDECMIICDKGEEDYE
jgi:hypothetical protein